MVESDSLIEWILKIDESVNDYQKYIPLIRLRHTNNCPYNIAFMGFLF